MQVIQESYIPLESGDREEHFKLSDIKSASWINERHQQFPNDSLKIRIFKYCLQTAYAYLMYVYMQPDIFKESKSGFRS